MIHDPIVEEVHRIRQMIMARYNEDLDAYVKDLQLRTEDRVRAGHKVLVISPQPAPVKSQPSKKVG